MAKEFYTFCEVMDILNKVKFISDDNVCPMFSCVETMAHEDTGGEWVNGGRTVIGTPWYQPEHIYLDKWQSDKPSIIREYSDKTFEPYIPTSFEIIDGHWRFVDVAEMLDGDDYEKRDKDVAWMKELDLY